MCLKLLRNKLQVNKLLPKAKVNSNFEAKMVKIEQIFFLAATKMDPNLCTKLSASISQASDVVSWLAASF